MKKLLVVLLSLGLIVAFSATASAAVDVKFGGSYYVVGAYESNPLLTPGDEAGYNHYSQAFFFQRVRLQPVFAIAEGLTFTARFDALEKQWGNTNWKGGTDDTTFSRRSINVVGAAAPAAGTLQQNQKIQESIEFERAYVTFMTGIGMFQVGYQNVDDWGTDFGDYSYSRPRIAYVTKAGPLTLGLTYEKVFENANANVAAPKLHATDADKDTYALTGIYNGKGIEAGLLLKYYAFNDSKPSGAKTTMNLVSPYVKATFGPLYVEGEATYWFGKYAQYELPAPVGTPDIDLKAWSAYIKGKFTMGPAYVGAAFSYASGNDLTDATKNTTAPSGGGTNWSPALILLNDWYTTWNQGVSSPSSPALSAANPVTSNKYNTIIYNGFVGFDPTPKLNVEAALTYATVAEKALSVAGGVVTAADSDKLGTEFDVSLTYKIYDNLTYMVGAGYLWTGDYFRGATAAGATPLKIDNDYILMNKLTLSF